MKKKHRFFDASFVFYPFRYSIPATTVSEGGPSIKQVENLLRDPNGIAVRPSGFDCVRPCHPERSGAKSNCEAAPSKARWDLGRTPLKMTRRGNTCQKSKGARAFVRTPFLYYRVVKSLPCVKGGGSRERDGGIVNVTC